MHDRSLTGRVWRISRDLPAEADVVRSLLEERRIEALGDGEIVEEYGHDARAFRDFEVAAARVEAAVARKERIAVFGDYDCDGIAATCLLVRFFRRRGTAVVARLPHRVRDGYGLKPPIVEELAREGITLLLTVDTGVTAVDAVRLAREKGMDVIVMDHHRLPDALPEASAILHPAFSSPAMDPWPCGAGVAWSVVRALEARAGLAEWDDFESDVALAAIATIADVMELRGPNRTLTHRGLQALAQVKDGPLKMLWLNAGLKPPFTSRDVGFGIAPRINAAGRMADPRIALHALLGDETSLMRLQELNRERQLVVEELAEELLAEAGRRSDPILCFADARYAPGVCGLLAGKLAERFGKPALVGWMDGGRCTASLRGVAEYDVTDGLKRCADLLESFGGHAMAAGCTFASGNLAAIAERLSGEASRLSAIVPTLVADAALPLERVTEEFCGRLKSLEPFGQGNPEPRFVVRGVRLEGARGVGKDGRHLQGSALGRKVIGFNLGHVRFPAGAPLDLLCRVAIDEWNGRKRPQLSLDDLRISTASAATVRPEPACLPS